MFDLDFEVECKIGEVLDNVWCLLSGFLDMVLFLEGKLSFYEIMLDVVVGVIWI